MAKSKKAFFLEDPESDDPSRPPSDVVQEPMAPGEDLFIAGRQSPGPFDAYLDEKAATDLGYQPEPEPEPGPAPQMNAKAVPPGPVKVSAPPPEEDEIGARPAPSWATALRQLPGVIGNAVALKHAKNPYSQIPGIMAENNRRNQRIGDQAMQERADYENKAAALARKRREQAKVDARQGVIDQRATTQFEQGQSDRTRAMDPNSDVNKRFREAAEAAYPGIRDQIPDWDTLTMQDAGSVQSFIDKKKAEAAATAKEGEYQRRRTDKNEDFQSREDYREKNRLERQRRWLSGKSGLALDERKAQAIAAIEKQYGGPDKVPPMLRQRVSMAETSKDIEQALSQGQVRQELSEGKETATELKERQAYEKATKDAFSLEDELDSFASTLRDLGVDPDNYRGEDIPGFGRVEQVVPDVVASERQMTARRAGLSAVASRVLTLSGKTATNQERATIKQIMGMGTGMSDDQVIRAYKQLRTVVDRMKERAEGSYKGAAQSYKANMAEKPAPAPAPATRAAEGVRIRDPKTGRTGKYPGTAEEARDEGYEVIQ